MRRRHPPNPSPSVLKPKEYRRRAVMVLSCGVYDQPGTESGGEVFITCYCFGDLSRVLSVGHRSLIIVEFGSLMLDVVEVRVENLKSKAPSTPISTLHDQPYMVLLIRIPPELSYLGTFAIAWKLQASMSCTFLPTRVLFQRLK